MKAEILQFPCEFKGTKQDSPLTLIQKLNRAEPKKRLLTLTLT